MTKPLAIWASIISMLAALSAPALAASVVGPAWATKLIFYNASNTDTIVMVAIAGTQDGCPNTIREMRYLDLTSGTTPLSLTMFTDVKKGWFTLQRGHRAQLFSATVDPNTRQPTYCLEGFNVGFDAFSASGCPALTTAPANKAQSLPNSKPGPQFNQDVSKYTPPDPKSFHPNGCSGFEGSLNLSGKVGGKLQPGSLEAFDITCVNGANAKIVCTVTPPAGGPYWGLGSAAVGPAQGGNITFKSTFQTQNSWVKIVHDDPSKGCDDNCVDPRTGYQRIAVYPYGCTTCSTYPDPAPPCGVGTPGGGNYAPQFCAAKSYLPTIHSIGNTFGKGCLVQRAPYNDSAKFGGTIQVTYMGPLAPPLECPKK